MRRGFQVMAGERCGDHLIATYLAKVNAMKRQFPRLAANDQNYSKNRALNGELRCVQFTTGAGDRHRRRRVCRRECPSSHKDGARLIGYMDLTTRMA